MGLQKSNIPTLTDAYSTSSIYDKADGSDSRYQGTLLGSCTRSGGERRQHEASWPDSRERRNGRDRRLSNYG